MKNRYMDYSKFFIENGAETCVIVNDGETWQVVLGYEKHNHQLLSIVHIEYGKYEIAAFKINSNGTISKKSWENPVMQKTFKDFVECRNFYKSYMEELEKLHKA